MGNDEFFEQYKTPEWQRFSAQIKERAGYVCEGCGATDQQLQAHHGYYEKDRPVWDYDVQTMWALCADCHQWATDCIHDVRLELAHINPVTLSPNMILGLRTEKDAATSERRGDHARGLSGILGVG